MNILEYFPNAVKCLDGHAEAIVTIEQEKADDRYYDMKVSRCSRCNMPLGSEYA